MPRPKKDPKLVKGEHLRVPVSAHEKEFIYEAATAMDGEFARWARALLLKAAGEWHATHGQKDKKPQAKSNESRRKVKASA
jgi:hypothetical protein